MHRTRALVAGLLLAAVACKDNPTTTSTVDGTFSQDIAVVASGAVAEDVDMMAGMDGQIGNLTAFAMSGAWLSTPPEGRPGVAGCTSTGGTFTCPPVSHNGLTVTRSVTFLNAIDGTQDSYNPLTTASIHTVSDVSGTVTHGNGTGTVAHHHDFTVSGLVGQETTRTVNGSGTESVSRTQTASGGETRSYTMTGSSTVANVVMPVRADGVDPWPLSGTITRTYNATATGGPNSGQTKSRTVVVTFNGTSTPGATVNGEAFTLDLANRGAHKK